MNLPNINEVNESYMDSFIVHSLENFKSFQRLTLSRVGLSIESSLDFAETGKVEYGGQTDVKAWFKYKGETILIMIENKITHNQQPNQARRYRERGAIHLKKGECDKYTTLMIAPNKYIHSTTADYDNKMSIEEIKKHYTQTGLEYERLFSELLITKSERGYIKVENADHTQKWKSIYQRIIDLYPYLNPTIPNAKSGAEFYQMRPTTFDYKKLGIKLVYKFQSTDRDGKDKRGQNRHRVDLEFSYKFWNTERLRQELSPLLNAGMKLSKIGNNGSIALRMTFDDVSYFKSYDEQFFKFERGISGLNRMCEFYVKNKNTINKCKI